MKMKVIKILSSIVVLGALAAGTVALTSKTEVAANQAADITSTTNENKITVTGDGSVSVTPDIAYVQVGVETLSKDAKTAQAENNKKMTDVINKIKAMGIDEKDIRTSNYNIYAQYDYNNGNKITGYVVNNSVSVTLKDIDTVGSVIDAAVEAGANSGGNIQFGIADSTEYYKKALALAIENAKIKGDAIAESLNVTIGKPSEVTELQGYNYPTTTMLKEAAYDRAAGTMPVSLGQLEVKASIQAVYKYQ